MLVHNALQIAEQLRCILNLIKNARSRMQRKKAHRVIIKTLTLIKILQTYVIIIWIQMPRKRRLTRLPRPTYRNNWI